MGIAMLDCLCGGVLDVRLPGHRQLGERNLRVAGPDATGVFSVIGPFQVDLFAKALLAVAVERIEFAPPAPMAVELRYVLAQPWSYQRLIAAVETGRRGDPAPAVKVARLSTLAFPPFYMVLDGSHRAFAARDSGKVEIEAQIHEEYRSDPSAFCLHGDILMREVEGVRWPVSPKMSWGLPVEIDEAVVSPDMIYTLQALGVRMDPYDGPPTFDMSLARAVHRQLSGD